jgi:hypothetical protein
MQKSPLILPEMLELERQGVRQTVAAELRSPLPTLPLMA